MFARMTDIYPNSAVAGLLNNDKIWRHDVVGFPICPDGEGNYATPSM